MILNKGVHKNAIAMKIYMSTITRVHHQGNLVEFQVLFSIILLMFFIDWFTIFLLTESFVIFINQF